MIRVLITDDDHLMRQSLRLFLRRAPDVEIVGEARDGQEAIELAQQLVPDVITMDIKMPRLDGLQATQRISATPTASKILMVAMSWDNDLVQRAVNYGAKGYLAKTESFDELLPAIRALQAGQTYFSKTISLLLRGPDS